MIEISVRDLHNDTIKTSKNSWLESVVDSMTQKLMIRDTTLRSFIPPQFCEITPKLRHICVCEICIIPKDMQIDLNIFRIRLLTDLQQKSVGIHKRNSLFITTSARHYKDKVFEDGECLHATIKDAYQCITSLPIKTKIWL